MRDYKRLLEYYIEYIEKEEINQLTLDIESNGKKFLTDVSKQEQFFLNNTEQVSIDLNNKAFKGFFSKLTKGNHLFYGYPILITNRGKISPIFFVELLFNTDNENLTLIKGSIAPEFNHYILKNRGLLDNTFAIKEY